MNTKKDFTNMVLETFPVPEKQVVNFFLILFVVSEKRFSDFIEFLLIDDLFENECLLTGRNSFF